MNPLKDQEGKSVNVVMNKKKGGREKGVLREVRRVEEDVIRE